ncbi:N(6)-adenine-specific DNA methyltransferase METTL4 isoform X2 [Nasonia vitripennis]|uniref:Methyltransferase-like protein 4 n=1 Tax=Nasonia vitripennis TaxID=7425 RepID=A0A7M7Q2L1_NASVI|nr:N(6)-adenine-specific DNA methyltransferase METTL4 isoform X2 [Nasonia vitripennis]
MSILLTTEEGWIISHLHYLNDIYKHVQHEQQYKTLQIKETFFKITSPYLRQNQIERLNKIESNNYSSSNRKRKMLHKLPHNILEQNDFVKDASQKILKKAQALKLFKKIAEDNNVESREESKKFFTTFPCTTYKFYGSNTKETPIIAEFQNEKYVFPEYSEFYCYDIRQIQEVFSFSKNFDLILLDPPWWNKSIRRKRKKHHESSYNMMHDKELTKIPVGNLLSSKGIVAVWCTNSSTHLNSILYEIFPNWGVTFMAKWYWLKITQNGEMICNFNEVHGKQPYELLIFGTTDTKLIFKIPDQKIVISVPSAVHSHKPPLTDFKICWLEEDLDKINLIIR